MDVVIIKEEQSGLDHLLKLKPEVLESCIFCKHNATMANKEPCASCANIDLFDEHSVKSNWEECERSD